MSNLRVNSFCHILRTRSALRNVAILLSSLLAASVSASITDANRVVYEIVNEAEMTVKVSQINNTIFNTLAVDIVIPPEVMNTASTAGYSDGPYKVVAIENGAFSNCPGITSVTITAPITQIAYETFKNCTDLTSVIFPETVTSIASNAFQGCSSLTNVGDLTNVTKLETSAFEKCTSLKTIDLPEGLTSLGVRVFEGCTALEQITIPSTITQLPSRGFLGCTALESVTISGNSLTDIQNSCFQGCTNLAAPIFPASLKTIGDRSFAQCNNLGTLTLTPNLDISIYAFTLSGISTIVWPDQSLTLHDNAFNGVHTLKNLTIPSWLTTVTKQLFVNAADLETITFSEGVTEIDESAFNGCKKLTTVSFPESLETIGQTAFNNCEQLTDPHFPSTMTAIKANAFTGCKALRDIVLPAGASMGSTVFNSTTLSSVTFPEEPMGKIESQPFGCQAEITSISIPKWMKRIPANLCYNWPKLATVSISEGVDTIGRQAFCGPTSIASIALPSTVTLIEDEAFKNSTQLTSIALNEGLKKIGSSAFFQCNKLTSAEIPSTVETIGNKSFSICSALETVTFKENADNSPVSSFREIDVEAFNQCGKLTTVTLPSTIRSIGDHAFAQCRKLSNINWPASLQKIGGYAFHQCNELTSVTFNADETIGDRAFLECGKIAEINFPDEPCSFGSHVFDNNDAIAAFTFPLWMIEIPEGFCYTWKKLAEVTMHPGIEIIGKQAFANDGLLHNVVFPDNIKEIREQAFLKCNYTLQLRDESGQWARDENNNFVFDYFGEVILPDGINVKSNAFEGSTVTKITFEGCATFGQDCFKDLKKITEFGFPSCLDTIPGGFCNGWDNLTKVVLPGECVVIGKSAFKGCSALKSMTFTGYESSEGEEEDAWIFPPKLRAIKASAFESSSISNINWPDYRIELGDSVFRFCQNLVNVTIPRWMDKMPANCFEFENTEKTNLLSIEWEDRTLPGSASSIEIGKQAFQNAAKLQSVTFPEIDVTLGNSAFYSCKNLQHIGWNSAGVKLGQATFAYCESLTELDIPDYVTEIPSQCFRSTKGLTKVNLGRNVSSIGNYAFEVSGVNELVWPDNLTDIDHHAFYNTKLTEVVVPSTVNNILNYAFGSCSELLKAVISEGTTYLDEHIFSNCQKLESIALPSTLSVISGSYICSNDKALKEVIFAEGLTTVPYSGFNDCKALKEVVIPKSVNTIRNIAFTGSGLETVRDYGEHQTIYHQAFDGCKDLTTFYAYGAIDCINPSAFLNCSALKDFIYESETPIGDIQYNAFEGCTALETFPRLYAGSLGQWAFKNCSSLRQLYLPVKGGFYNNLFSPANYLNGATSLESLIFPYEGNMFKLRDIDIAGAQLRALSFSYAKGIIRPYGDVTTSTILDYAPDKSVELPNRGAAKLMVPRGERWKYMEAGYGQLFDIIEIKDPQINIEGHIHSNFFPEEGKNHYTAYLRWEVPYSDLNPDDETTVTVFRNDEVIGNVVFGKPEVVESAPGVKCDHDIIRVSVTLNGEPGGFYGDFNYPVFDDKGKLKYYQRVYMSESDYMYFDAYTHRRLVNIDKYGYTSWFIMKDEFKSPDLRTPGVAVPDRYTYTARMNGYKYYTLANNDNLEEKDGLMYHKVWHEPDSIRSTAYVMRTAQATPAISFTGLYTTQEIKNDVNHALEPTVPHDRRTDKRYSIKLSLDTLLMAQKGRDLNSTIENYLVKGITIYRVNDNNSRTKLTDFTFPNRNGEYTFIIPPTDDPGPGKRYQIDTYSYANLLGTFGSAILSIPDAPEIEAPVSTMYVADNGHNHNGVKWNGTITIIPSVGDTGYGDGKTKFTKDSYHIGVWRTINATDTWEAGYYRLPSEDESEVLLHHYSGLTEDGKGTPCEQCDVAAGVTHAEDAITYQDLYDLSNTSAHKVEYLTRMYVKVPDKSLGNDTMWMIAEDSDDTGGRIISGVENVAIDDASAEVRYFDLQGRPLSAPTAGTPCLRVTPTTSSIIVP